MGEKVPADLMMIDG
jgi:Ca2+-transporting ATPase